MNRALRLKLYEAFELRSQLEFQNQDHLNEESITFSPEFEQRMGKVFRYYDHFWYHQFGNQAKRIAATIILAILFTFGTTMSVEALREPFLNFIAETFEKFTKISFTGETGTEIEEFIPLEPIDPSYIPEGYELISSNIGFSGNTKTYSNNKNIIIYSQSLNDGTQIYLDTEDAYSEKVNINEIEGICITEKNEITVFLADELYHYTVTGTAEKDEIIKVAKSILEKN